MHEIIATVGPTSIEKDIIRRMHESGTTDFRINLSHSNPESLIKYSRC